MSVIVRGARVWKWGTINPHIYLLGIGGSLLPEPSSRESGIMCAMGSAF